ncbi:MAG: ATP-binding protein [Bacteroidetes bacterium]|nr:ATP-binding protein [Bacteroidota bacterium]
MKFLTLLILSNLSVYLTYSQIQPPPAISPFRLKVDNWQMDQGLPVNSILTLGQTADGWLFLGTEEGLVRFDGNTFKTMNKSVIPELNVNFISALLGTRDTSLWIGTEGDGLIMLKNKKFIRLNKSNGLSDDRIFALSADSSGGIWVGTSGCGVNYLKDGKITKYDTANGLACNYIRSIVIDAKGRIWIGTQKGLSVIVNGKIQNYFSRDGLSDDFIESLAIDKDQNLWIGTKSGGLNLFKQCKFSVYTMKDGLTNNAVTALLFDANEILWIGTNGGGITRMMNGQFYPFTTKEGLSSDLIVTLFEDREGNIWAGSSGSGIDRIKRKLIQTISGKEGLPGDVILPIFEDHAGVLWLGVAGKGLNRLENGKVQTFTPKNGLPEQLVLAITEDLDNTIWVGTAGGGLTSFKNGKFTTYTSINGLSNNVVTALHFDRSGVLWAGTKGGGINRFNNGKFSTFMAREGLSNDNVTCILEDRKKNLWVGTESGLNRIYDNKITVVNQKNGLSDDYILSLYEDREGNLWFGTAANGFNLFRDGKITQFTTKDGLINEVVLNIIEDDFGYFWISCNKGIYKIKRQNLLDFADLKVKSLNPVSYGKADGMATIECNGGVSPAGCKTRDGMLLFPTMRGVAIIDPGLMKTVSSCFSPVFIEEFLVDGQAVKITSPLSIPSYSNRLEFRYAGLNYTNPEKIKYRCMLVGFDKDWVDCGLQRSVYYTNIPGGDYKFIVMASNESGLWDENYFAELKFHLKPPFFRSFLFYLIVAIFFSLLLFFGVYYFLIRFQRNKLKLLVEERTYELRQKMISQKQTQEKLQQTNAELLIAKEQAESGDRLKTSFMNNISHEIRTPLNGIIGFNQLLSDPELTPSQREHYLSIVKSNSARLINTVTDYMDISLLVSRNQKMLKKLFAPGDLLEEIYYKFLKQCQSKNLTLTIITAPLTNKLQINSDPELLTKVLRHLVDNAIKFTNQGSISFGFEEKDSDLKFFVKDTGVGFKKESQANIFDSFMQGNPSDTRGYEGSGLGLSIVKGIVELLGGCVWLETEIDKGSSIFFTIPVEITADEQPVFQKTVANLPGKPIILIAEDEESGRLLLERILQKKEVELLIVADGQQAVDACCQNPMISLVLMDLKMPTMDGFVATEMIKAFRPDLPVIAITAYALSGDENRAFDAGCDDYIAKPFDMEALLKKINKHGLNL